MIQLDSRLEWTQQVANVIKKANKDLNGIKIIMGCFKRKQLLRISTSKYYSILYYNSEVWLLNNLKGNLKRDLMAA
jgi:hypothetical protein